MQGFSKMVATCCNGFQSCLINYGWKDIVKNILMLTYMEGKLFGRKGGKKPFDVNKSANSREK